SAVHRSVAIGTAGETGNNACPAVTKIATGHSAIIGAGGPFTARETAGGSAAHRRFRESLVGTQSGPTRSHVAGHSTAVVDGCGVDSRKQHHVSSGSAVVPCYGVRCVTRVGLHRTECVCRAAYSERGVTGVECTTADDASIVAERSNARSRNDDP